MEKKHSQKQQPSQGTFKKSTQIKNKKFQQTTKLSRLAEILNLVLIKASSKSISCSELLIMSEMLVDGVQRDLYDFVKCR